MNNILKFPKINHLSIIIILFLKFILPILLFGSVVIIAHDNLEVAVPHDYIIQKKTIDNSLYIIIKYLQYNLTLDNILKIQDIKDIDELLNVDENLDSYI
jgi:hypothetical protein